MRRLFTRITWGMLGAGWMILAIRALAGLPTVPGPSADPLLQNWLEVKGWFSSLKVGGVQLRAENLVRDWYARQNYRLLWSDANGPSPQAQALLDLIRRADEEGLWPQDYHDAQLQRLIKRIQSERENSDGRINPVRLAALDLLLTDAFFLYAAHATYGRVDPETLVARDFPATNSLDELGLLETAIRDGSVASTLQGLLPSHTRYMRLKSAWQDYRRAASTSWSKLPRVVMVKSDLSQTASQRLAVLGLRSKLKALGDLPAEVVADTSTFDEALEAGLKRYQERHGLEVTGALDEATWLRINQPLEQDLHIMMINLERWRWLPRDLGNPCIMVNIPAFQLDVFSGEQSVLSMKVVVGQQYSRTPVFSDQLRWVVINPWWEIPPNIVLNQKLWSIKNRPDYFEDTRVQVLQGWGETAMGVDPRSINWSQVPLQDFYTRYRFQQAPGPANPLGRVKFVFPNRYNVYLHDTPERELFDAHVRDFSSGCIRLERPLDLAAYLLGGNSRRTQQRLQNAIASGKEERIRLTRPVPVHILYQTCWVEADGTIEFRNDIYGRDKNFGQVLDPKPLIVP